MPCLTSGAIPSSCHWELKELLAGLDICLIWDESRISQQQDMENIKWVWVKYNDHNFSPETLEWWFIYMGKYFNIRLIFRLVKYDNLPNNGEIIWVQKLDIPPFGCHFYRNKADNHHFSGASCFWKKHVRNGFFLHLHTYTCLKCVYLYIYIYHICTCILEKTQINAHLRDFCF